MYVFFFYTAKYARQKILGLTTIPAGKMANSPAWADVSIDRTTAGTLLMRIRLKAEYHTCKKKRSALTINALRLAMHRIVCTLVANNQQNNKRPPLPNANKVENLLLLG